MSRMTVSQSPKELKRPVPPVTAVLDLLEAQWGQESNPDVTSFDEPLDGLILIVLSQNTNDRNRDMAFDRLKAACPTWADAAALSQAELISLIRPAGLCDSKSATIIRVLGAAKDLTGQYSLGLLRKKKPAEAWNFMTSIKGVGVKTAACVMVFDLGFPAFPVDTHVARFCRRMGWAPEKASPAAIQEMMEGLVPDSRKAGAHLNIITHGRRVCKARGPLCGDCLLRGLCPASSA
ncbi:MULTISPECIES: endonuclease III domain-containing protein [Jonquetella]|uniref:Putative endoIII-related endonuclease n=1 Tax=Jonquetella anthropi DSM 22815 TaxID=885272 RepID=H0UKH9_9BACT|nr:MULTISPECIES: base excision DNA repair protein, HhH-GPD family [Jonquetella]EEX48379.1 base excision DNA repair protein, HhH-GPD family [Jonquetella anthropi E3_33 E1]EHM13188.1 putative endoIII-related endonuclease [Jonquetella anthropi DSM 22815]ERL23660.1 base excision DNA repair protein, HhH-GPD family [Jonquetella sp. BV3C21]